MVQIQDPAAFNEAFHERFTALTGKAGLLTPKQVAYTVFPHGLYAHAGGGTRLYAAYNRPGGMFERVTTSWGTYFRRMTAYQPNPALPAVNQLENLVKKIKKRKAVFTAAYHISIAYPGTETVRERGGPCLNHIWVQLAPAPRRLGLLCVYRNHDFLEKAYGNYWALSNLLRFLCSETGYAQGVLTCVSSQAYTARPAALRKLVRGCDGVTPATIPAA
jgi:hypothetical protein